MGRFLPHSLIIFARCLFSLLYVSALIALLPATLWGVKGLVWSVALSMTFLGCLFFRAEKRIAVAMQAAPNPAPEMSVIRHLITEYARRLGLAAPGLLVISSPALNAAVFGLSRQRAKIVLTTGLIDSLDRKEVSALLAELMTQIWFGDFIPKTFLARLLRYFEVLAGPRPTTAHDRITYPWRLLLRRILLYPLALPLLWSLGPSSRRETSEFSLKLSRHPRELAEVFRKLEVAANRLPQTAPFSIRHLFLIYPRTSDALANLFFTPQSLALRIRKLETQF